MTTILTILGVIVLSLMIISFFVNCYFGYKITKTIIDMDSKS
jgi:hypothetical protein